MIDETHSVPREAAAAKTVSEAPQAGDRSARAPAQDTDGLAQLMRAANADGAPVAARPVERWDPPYCGDIGLKIKRDGTWIHQGAPISRMAIVKVFSSILRKDADGQTYLVTPAERVDVTVEDAPFLAVELAVSSEGETQALAVRTNVDDVVSIGPEHPLRFAIEPSSGGLKPYIRIRGRLDALATRAVYSELVNLAVTRADGTPGIWSGGVFWPLDDGQPLAQEAP